MKEKENKSSILYTDPNGWTVDVITHIIEHLK